MRKYLSSSDSSSSHSPTPRDVSAAWTQITALAAAVDASSNKWLMENHNLGITEYRAILILSAQEDRELRITELASRLGISQSSATRLVERLERKNLALRDTCPDDGRGVYAVLTAHGVEVAGNVQQSYERMVGQLLKGAVEEYPQLNLANIGHSLAVIQDFLL